ncbi:ASCH domain-containing protein [Massilia sp. DWR3-1-1]|uniref:ASCH domain-containing protein n=1 Tax=Massilia sp. DWR3-1-1 TaxID=2804559 RepID=UPI003CEE7C75
MKISLYHDGAVGVDGLLFASAAAAESTLRRHAQRALHLAFEAPHDYNAIGTLIYMVQRLGLARGAGAGAGAVIPGEPVDPRPAGLPLARKKRLTFWGAHDDDDSLPLDVIAGRKSVTADTVEAYYQPYGPFGDGSYAPGELIEVYDLRQRLRCIIRATKVYTIKCGAIPEEVWRGEGFDSAAAFLQCHREALTPLELHDEFELVTLHFALVDVIPVDAEAP